MGSRKVLVSLLMLLALFLAGAVAAEPATSKAADNIITGLDVHPGQHSTRIVLRGEKTPTFTVFKLKNPDRLVVDLIHTDLRGVDIPTSVEDAHISRIASTQFKQAGSIVSRFIIGLKPDVRFNAKADGPAVVVTISSKDAVRQPSSIEPAVTTKSPITREKIAEPVESKVMVVKTPPVKTPPKDFRVVKSHGDKNKAKKVKIKRIKTSAANSITILANRELDAYQVLEVYAPFRIVLDVYGASMSSKKHERRLSSKHVERLRAARHPDKVRVVIDCAKGKQRSYKIKHLKRGIQIDFTDNAVKAAARKPGPAKVKKEKAATKPVEKIAKTTEPAAKKPIAKPKIANLKDIDFRQEPTQARVILELEGDVTPKVTHADNRSTVLEIPYCKIPLILERTLDTSEFGSALLSLSAYRVRGEDKVKLVAVTSTRISSKLVRQGGKLHWVFDTAVKKKEVAVSSRIEKPGSSVYSYEPNQVAGYSVRRPDLASGSGSGKKKRRRFTGKRISLDFKEADIHNILRLISEVAKLNIITSDDVKGKITITMRNVPWDQALDIILKTKKLGKVRHGNIIRVAPITELAKENELAQKAAAARMTLEPLRVRLIPVNYAVAKEIEKQVKDILSERGTVNVDKRTNVLIVKDI
ncbi:MAG: AMIN domain-containing protein [Deltaproteobacteria bacterium]|nr:AMIN domain-containing protein [Deltaproteobacteria bacterium]